MAAAAGVGALAHVLLTTDGRLADALRRRSESIPAGYVARVLVPMNYARGERFDHDPATKFGPVPRLEAAVDHARPRGLAQPSRGLDQQLQAFLDEALGQ